MTVPEKTDHFAQFQILRYRYHLHRLKFGSHCTNQTLVMMVCVNYSTHSSALMSLWSTDRFSDLECLSYYWRYFGQPSLYKCLDGATILLNVQSLQQLLEGTRVSTTKLTTPSIIRRNTVLIFSTFQCTG